MVSREDPDSFGASPLLQMRQIAEPSQGSNFGTSLSTNKLTGLHPADSSTPQRFASDQVLSDLVPSRTDSDTICRDCYEIDFQKVLRLESTALANQNGVLLADLGTRLARASSSSCALCRLFEATAQNFMDEDSQIGLELRAFSFLRLSNHIQYFFCPRYLKLRDQPYMAVVPRGSSGNDAKQASLKAGYIFCHSLVDQPTNIFSPKIIPRSADLSLVNQWREYCATRHKRLCGGKVAQLSGLLVIDCYSLRVVSAPLSCLYVALSYVWSKANRESEALKAGWNNTTDLQLQCLPRSIQDAITVTKEIGLRYLWVDRFCIDQRNPDEKHHQIQNMDTVYRGAEITIIAAAGLDEDYGLPGVGRTPRTPQLGVTVQDVQIVCTMTHPHRPIRESVWSTRGWAYQEAVLSRRRIVFTDHQLYFECNAMNCYESLKGDLDTLHTKNKYKSLQMLHSGIFAGRDQQAFGPTDMENLSLEGNLERYLQLISNYSSRDLTFEEDSLTPSRELQGISQSQNIPFSTSGDFRSHHRATPTMFGKTRHI